MGTKVVDAPTAAGVECPKKSGEMGEDEPCRKCPYWEKCIEAVLAVIPEEV